MAAKGYEIVYPTNLNSTRQNRVCNRFAPDPCLLTPLIKVAKGRVIVINLTDSEFIGSIVCSIEDVEETLRECSE